MSTATSLLPLLYLIPTLILLVVGIALTARARAEHGRGATLGLVGCVVLLVAAILQGGYQVMIPSLVESGGFEVITMMSMITGLLFTVLNVVGTGLLIFGVVARRGGPQPQQQAQGQGQGWQQPYGQQPYGQQPQYPQQQQPHHPQQPPPGQWPSR
ncbi:hypothetical protein [Nonomuraea dietziae]|uniref:hypothetical protein n=1 Tax=Nonomuraea dietziae TaxID=65515 RepID=UPI0033F928EA